MNTKVSFNDDISKLSAGAKNQHKTLWFIWRNA